MGNFLAFLFHKSTKLKGRHKKIDLAGNSKAYKVHGIAQAFKMPQKAKRQPKQPRPHPTALMHIVIMSCLNKVVSFQGKKK